MVRIPPSPPGDRQMLPVLVDMERLFELFVVEWLKQHVSERYSCVGRRMCSSGWGRRFR